jgi:Flp pilus assembly protein TadG
MRLLKIIAVFFIIYFIRRFFQMYRAMKQIQEQAAQNAAKEQQQATSNPVPPNDKVVDAEFKVMD